MSGTLYRLISVYNFKNNIINEEASKYQPNYVPMFTGGAFILYPLIDHSPSFSSFKYPTNQTAFKVTPDLHNIYSRKKVQFFYSKSDKSLFASVNSRLNGLELEGDHLNEIRFLERRAEVGRRSILRNLPVVSPALVTLAEASDDGDTPLYTNSLSSLRKKVNFSVFYHPYACSYKSIVVRKGINGLYTNETQEIPATDIFSDIGVTPSDHVGTPYPREELDFSVQGAYSVYNWELFFHIPLLISERLKQNQKFEEARKWLHFIFDPTRSSSIPEAGSERFWITRPFKEEIINGIMTLEEIMDDSTNPGLRSQLEYWEGNPFKPHAVARMRIAAYMRSVVMKYIENLVEWGDQLFRKDTLESINEATLLYVLAANIFGKRPRKIPARAVPVKVCFENIKDDLGSFNNPDVDIESYIFPSRAGNPASVLQMPLFCIPGNDINASILGYCIRQDV